jgi:hypothetical protein
MPLPRRYEIPSTDPSSAGDEYVERMIKDLEKVGLYTVYDITDYSAKARLENGSTRYLLEQGYSREDIGDLIDWVYKNNRDAERLEMNPPTEEPNLSERNFTDSLGETRGLPQISTRISNLRKELVAMKSQLNLGAGFKDSFEKAIQSIDQAMAELRSTGNMVQHRNTYNFITFMISDLKETRNNLQMAVGNLPVQIAKTKLSGYGEYEAGGGYVFENLSDGQSGYVAYSFSSDNETIYIELDEFGYTVTVDNLVTDDFDTYEELSKKDLAKLLHDKGINPGLMNLKHGPDYMTHYYSKKSSMMYDMILDTYTNTSGDAKDFIWEYLESGGVGGDEAWGVAEEAWDIYHTLVKHGYDDPTDMLQRGVDVEGLYVDIMNAESAKTSSKTSSKTRTAGMGYRWEITRDHLAEEWPDEKSSVGVQGPRGLDPSLSENAEKFRMLDDDRNVYYEGIIYGDYDGFEPLDDYGMPNAGAVIIEYKNPQTGAWEVL